MGGWIDEGKGGLVLWVSAHCWPLVAKRRGLNESETDIGDFR